MIGVAIYLRDSGAALNFHFETPNRWVAIETAIHKAQDAIEATEDGSYPPWIGVTDDFGHSARIEVDQIAAIYAIDIAKDMALQVEKNLMVARFNAQAQRKAQADPLLGGQLIAAKGILNS